jgi:hypothetical protein
MEPQISEVAMMPAKAAKLLKVQLPARFDWILSQGMRVNVQKSGLMLQQPIAIPSARTQPV